MPIGFSLISYQATDSIFRAFAVGLSNTLLVAVVGIVFATILGFIIGLARLSPNWLMSRLAYWYVEFIRNTPLLLILVFLYSFKQLLPEIGEVEANDWGIYATVKGFYVPKPLFTEGLGWVGYLPLIGIAATLIIRRWARLRQENTGERFPIFWAGLGLIVVAPLLIYFALAARSGSRSRTRPVSTFPAGWNCSGVHSRAGRPCALHRLLYRGECPRRRDGDIQGPVRGRRGAWPSAQSGDEAGGGAPGDADHHPADDQPVSQSHQELDAGDRHRYPEIINVGNSILQKVPSVEVVAVWMAIFLFLSLVTSFIMNWYNRRIALSER